jgi:dTDP-4-dehydrorhamnose reductase
MKILIVGGAGMLGHELVRHFARKAEVFVTYRSAQTARVASGRDPVARAYEGIDAGDFGALAKVFDEAKPHAVLNCVGIIKQLEEAKNAISSIRINSLLPHLLLEQCSRHDARLVHFSTDCVFSGRTGSYTEADVPDATDLYGRSKLLGEVQEAPGITIRSSIIGRELNSRRALLDWFLSQSGKTVRGFRRAIYSGFTTIEMARIVERVLPDRKLNGLWQVASVPISKYDLLCLVRDRFGLPIAIEPDEVFSCDRSLKAERFNQATGYVPPSWPAMIDELAAREGK